MSEYYRKLTKKAGLSLLNKCNNVKKMASIKKFPLKNAISVLKHKYLQRLSKAEKFMVNNVQKSKHKSPEKSNIYQKQPLIQIQPK